MSRHTIGVNKDGTFKFERPRHESAQQPSNLRPTHNFVHCRAIARPVDKESRIIRPDTAEPDHDIAEVLAVGPGVYTPNGDRVPCCCKPGDKVIVNITRITWVDDQVRRRVDAPGVAFVLPDDGIIAVVEQ